MKFISLFAGIGGMDLGLERAGMECVAQVEIEDYPTRVLEKHWPDVPKFRDVRDVGKHNLPTADLICGGFPCQPHSTSGKRLASEDERDLWGEYARIISEIKPRWVVAENVRGLLSSEDGWYFGRVLKDLAYLGYDAEWSTVQASALGADHQRERIFIIAYPLSKRRPIMGKSGKIRRSCINSKNHIEREFYSEHIPLDFKRFLTNPISGVIRNDDGISEGLDRLKGVGNAVVPQVAEYVGRAIMQAEMEMFA